MAIKTNHEIDKHEDLLTLRTLCTDAKKILDVGCGNGAWLNALLPEGKKGWGIDPDKKSIISAKKSFPCHNYAVAVGENLPFKTSAFDLVYSAFVIEHCSNPINYILEMIRVCKPGGYIVILAPNYGAPVRKSPNSSEFVINKLLEGLVKDFFPHSNLDWSPVAPITGSGGFDSDAAWEPYLYSLLAYLSKLPVVVERYSSLWQLESENTGLVYRFLINIGLLGLPPLKFWGPQLFVVAKKRI